MSEIIEHSDNGNGNVVRVGESSAPVSLKVYQDIYHQVTGRTEQIRKRYTEHILASYSDIEEIHHKICQLCDVHNIVASNEVVVIFHEKERKEQFTSFERFKAYNANSTSPTVNLVLRYNFSIIPAGREHPQEYVVSIRLTNRIAMYEQIEKEMPPYMRGHMLGYIGSNTAEITVDYADYVVARGFLESFDEWMKGCKKSPTIPWLNFLRRWSHWLDSFGRIGIAGIIMYSALLAIPIVIASNPSPEKWAKLLVIYSGSAYILTTLTKIATDLLEESIDSYPILSYLKINKGDDELIEKFSGRRQRVFLKFFIGALLSIALSIVANRLDKLI